MAAWLEAGNVNIMCNAEASKGSIFIPSEHVAKVAANAKDGVQLTVRASRTKSGRFGDYSVSLHHDARSKPVKLGRPTKLRFVNASARLHPMHLHG